MYYRLRRCDSCRECCRYGINAPLTWAYMPSTQAYFDGPISGQAITPAPNGPWYQRMGIWFQYAVNTSGGRRAAKYAAYWRDQVAPHAGKPNLIAATAVAINPNIFRWLPGVAPEVEPALQHTPGQLVVPSQGIRDRIMEATATAVRTQQRKHLREPPDRRTKETKVLTRAGRFALALAKVMDGISEGSEVITSFYDALPEELRKQIEKARFPNARWIKDKRTGKWRKVGMDRPGDQYGQYGIEGADWKAQALWEHWDKVDMEAAMENLFENYVEDKVIGGIHRKLPRNYGNANPEGDRVFAKRLEELVDYVLENL